VYFGYKRNVIICDYIWYNGGYNCFTSNFFNNGIYLFYYLTINVAVVCVVVRGSWFGWNVKKSGCNLVWCTISAFVLKVEENHENRQASRSPCRDLEPLWTATSIESSKSFTYAPHEVEIMVDSYWPKLNFTGQLLTKIKLRWAAADERWIIVDVLTKITLQWTDTEEYCIIVDRYWLQLN